METLRLLTSACLLAVCWLVFHPAAVHSEASPSDGKGLLPCPDTPNCVSSKSERKGQGIDPLVFQGSPRQAMDCLKQVITRMKRSKIVAFDDLSLKAESRTLLGFVDDVSFEVDVEAGVIHMRSASRVGYWDMGENRRRLEKIRQLVRHHCQQQSA